MRSGTRSFVIAALIASVSAPGLAQPRRGGPPPDAPRREELLRKVHTMRLVELGELLELDTAATLKLGERLKPFEEQRVKLRVEGFEAMSTLKRANRGDKSADAVGAARALAESRVKLAQLDQRELDEVLKGLPPEKAAKAALFIAQFNRRVERMAGEMHRRHREPGPDETDE